MAETSKTEVVNGVRATLFRDGDVPVYLLPDGRFAARKAGKWVSRTSVKSLDKAMASEQPFLTIMSCRSVSMHTPDKVAIREIIDFQETRTVGRDGKKEYIGWAGDWYVFIPGVPEQLNDLYKRISAAERAFYEEYKAIMKDAQRVSKSNFRRLLKGVDEDDDD